MGKSGYHSPSAFADSLRSEELTMDIESNVAIGTNITVVLEALDLEQVSRDELRGALAELGKPVVSEIPDQMIALVYPGANAACLMGDRRIRANFSKEGELGEDKVSHIASQARQVLSGLSVVAYGFNFDSVVTIVGPMSAEEDLKSALIANPTALETKLGGRIGAATVQLAYVKDSKECTLRLEPISDRQIRTHLNVHFAVSELPAAQELAQMAISEFDELERILREL